MPTTQPTRTESYPPTADPAAETEIRLCLVMYGGISLAVYMNGIAREYFDFVRGRGIWGIFKRLANVDATVDVVSGASAGGLNGLFLSYALCGGREFGSMADLWRKEAGIEDLLQHADAAEPRSLLRSDYMERKLAEAFKKMPISEAPRSELKPSKTPELDCFLAVTNFYGRSQLIAQMGEHPIPTRSHRSAIHFKHRAGRKEPFGPPDEDKGAARPEVLAQVARATSAFPGAFQPVLLRGKDLHDRFATDDMNLDRDESAWFVDGGVLDNKPFRCALPAIFGRHADRKVDRILFFVEPDPDAEGPAEDAGKRPEPNFLQTAMASISTLPSYQSILDEIRSLDAHNRKLEMFSAVFDCEQGPQVTEPPPEQWTVHNRARLHQLIWGLAEHLSDGHAAAMREAVLGSPGPADDKPANVRFFERVLSSHVVDLPRPAPSLRIGNQQVPLEVLDLEQVKRAYYHQVYALYEQVKDRPDDRAARETMTFLTDRIDMLLFLAAQAGTAIERVGSEKTAPAMDALAGTLRRALSGPPELMKVVQGEPGDKALICEREVSGGSQTTDFVARYKRAHGAAAADAPLGDLLPAFWATLSKKVGPEPVERFRRADAWRFAAQYAAEVGELDRVEYFRLSPREAADVPEGLPELARFREDPVARLAGRHLAHFAAFLDRAWRSNDIMWGRIDATAVLWDVLVRRRGYHLPRERARALAAELISKEWHKEPGELAELAALVQKYADGGVDERGFAQALLQTHQRHVLVDAVPGVIADAAGQHRSRGKVEAAKKSDGEIRPEAAQRLLEAFHDTIRDPLLRTAASEAVDALLTKQPQAIVDYVGERYAVGERGLAELPPERVATQALQAGRVVNAMLRAALPNRGLLSRLRWPLKPLGTALQTMHLVAHSIRRGLFPLVWLVTLLTSAAFGASSLLLLQGTDRWVLFGAALAVVGALLGAPNIWFGGSRLSWVRVPLLAGMLVAAVGVITTLHLSSTRPVTVGLANNPIVTWIAVMQAVIVAVLLGGTILLGARLGAASSERKRLQRTREDLEKERQALARFVAAMQQEAAKRNQPPATPAAVVVEIAATTPSGAIRVDSAPTVTVPRRP